MGRASAVIECNVGAFIIKIGFRGPLSGTTKILQVMIKAPLVWLSGCMKV